MAEVSITVNGRHYDITCDTGQEGRIMDLAAYADHKLQQIARAAGVWDEKQLLVLTALQLANEILEAHEAGDAAVRTATPPPVVQGMSKEDEQVLARALGDLAQRIEIIAQKVQAA